LIIIPMAGLSSRFTAAGYQQPKYMLEAHGRTLFDHAVLSFAAYFRSVPFLFIARDIENTSGFISERTSALGILDSQVVLLDEPTRGQGETVALGIARAEVDMSTPLTIFNIDTFRLGFRFPDWVDDCDGYLETFVGEGPNWSFVRPVSPGSDHVAETTEKVPISNFCCTGLYHFARAKLFQEAYSVDSRLGRDELQGGELYVAPLYNRLIAAGRDVRFTVVPSDDIIFCGVPAEYDQFRARPDIDPITSAGR
jgi:hypothetical protein